MHILYCRYKTIFHMLISRGLSNRYECGKGIKKRDCWQESIGTECSLFHCFAGSCKSVYKQSFYIYNTFNHSSQCKLGFFHHKGYLYLVTVFDFLVFFSDWIKLMHLVISPCIRTLLQPDRWKEQPKKMGCHMVQKEP